jgi:hypothetical protein
LKIFGSLTNNAVTNETPFSQEKTGISFGIVSYLVKAKYIPKIKQNVDAVMAVRKNISA